MSNPTTIWAIDPGTDESAFVRMDTTGIRHFAKVPNDDLLRSVACWGQAHGEVLCVEMIASYGMPVGKEVFDTCVYIGRLVQAWKGEHRLVYRREVKMHLCGITNAKDANIRQALIDLYGPGKEKAIGNKKNPGPLYGFSGDCWAALGVAVTVRDAK